MFISGVNNTGEKEKNVEIKTFSYFVKSLVHFTPTDCIFAYFSILGVGKLILAGLSNRWFRERGYIKNPTSVLSVFVTREGCPFTTA
jgi:hypothetical protein